MIRVPDTAGGKKGTCPRCSEKLLVPDLETAADAVAAPVSAVAPKAAPARVEFPPLESLEVDPDDPVILPPPIAPSPTLGLSPLGQLPVADEVAGVPASGMGLPPLEGSSSRGVSSRTKSKSKAKTVQGAWIIPVACALGLIGFLAWMFWDSRPKMEGDLTAHSESDFEIKPVVIPNKVSGLPDHELETVLKHLTDTPSYWKSTSSRVTLTGTKNGVEIMLKPGNAYHFVAVHPTVNVAFREYVTQHAAELDKPRLASIAKHAPQLFEDWQIQFNEKEPITRQKEYYDTIVLPTLVTGVGYHLEAVANGHHYPCVYEDDDGLLYFLLPNALKTFQLQGNRVAGGMSLPAKFQVKVVATAPEPKKKKAKSKAELESENDGPNPDLYKLDLQEVRDENRATRGKSRGEALTGNKSDQPDLKSKSKSKSDMMMDEENDLLDDEMPEKSKPKKGAPKKAVSKSS